MTITHLALDFGTTNSVIAGWDENAQSTTILAIPNLTDDTETALHLIPSLVYVDDGASPQLTIGQSVRNANLDQQNDNRLFRNFKRGIIATSTPPSRKIDGVQWNDHDAGRWFLSRTLESLPLDIAQIEQFVLTAPVAAFQAYLHWLEKALQNLASVLSDNIKIVDESTAAALGYNITDSEALVLVVDFGGGTLDLSLVQLPDSKEQTGGILGRLIGTNPNQNRATVIAKAGRNLGGSDVDQWLLSDLLSRENLTIDDLGNAYAEMLTRCEIAKITLSTHAETDFHIELGQKHIETTITRNDLNTLLHDNEFFTMLHRTIDKVMHTARQQGIFREDIHSVLMVGGTSLMPAVQETLRTYFDNLPVKAHKPFTAVVEGALHVARGFGVQDYLVHGYGIRHLDPISNTHQYDEIIPMGTPYPLDQPIEVLLGAAHHAQDMMELVIGEINTDAVAMVEVQYQDGQAVFVAQGSQTASDIVPLNTGDDVTILPLSPQGIPGEDRIKASLTINDRRELKVTVTDLHTNQTVLRDGLITTLR
jgi:molecular chaperone DnaK (HSP70)